MKESASSIWMLISAGTLNGIGQLVMRWGGRDAKVAFSWAHLGDWVVSSRWWIFGLLLSWTSGLLWALLLRNIRLVIALPVFAGISYGLSFVGSVALLGEKPSTTQYLGILCVTLGICLIVFKR
jgi:multidrug transporter EmrE-like cation transporter